MSDPQRIAASPMGAAAWDLPANRRDIVDIRVNSRDSGL
jgi:hypothetical protein